MTNQTYEAINSYKKAPVTSDLKSEVIDESIIFGIASKKRQMIFNQILRTKKDLIENLRSDNFPTPKVRKI